MAHQGSAAAHDLGGMTLKEERMPIKIDPRA